MKESNKESLISEKKAATNVRVFAFADQYPQLSWLETTGYLKVSKTINKNQRDLTHPQKPSFCASVAYMLHC